jgi:2Fe-2S ferredoxin
MAEVTYQDVTGTTRTIPVEPGESVMQTAVKNGVPGIVGECGGALSCSTCHVYVEEHCVRNLGPVGELEDEMLDGVADERRPTSRLSCQLLPDVGETLSVRTPETQY